MTARNFAAGIYFLLSTALFAQQALDNDAIVKMVKAGLGDQVIASMVRSQPGTYQVTPDAMVSLKGQGVSDTVLAAMAAKGNGSTLPAAGAVPTTTEAAQFDDMDLGVYRSQKKAWMPVPSEAVSWKTGGVLKSLATNGIIKGDVNGHIPGAVSKTNMNTPLEFVIKTADGQEATDYQLVRMHAKNDAREFRTLTGGVFHSSGGAQRDSVPFEQKKLVKHTYQVILPDSLGSGEYAFLAPGLSASTVGGSTGKAYTFHVIE